MKLSLLCTILFSISTHQIEINDPGKLLIGVWRGEAGNGQTILVEFTKTGDYNLIHGGQVLTCSDEDFGQIKYALDEAEKNQELWVVLYDDKTKQEYGRLSASFSNKNQQLKLILYFKNKAVDQIELTRSQLGS